MSLTETTMYTGRRWYAAKKMFAAIRAHKDDRGNFTKLEFRRIMFMRWMVWVEFQHEEEDS